MATLTVSIADSAVVNGSRSRTVTDAHLTRLIAWYRAKHPPTVLPDTRADGQILLAWFDGFMTATTNSVMGHEREVARATAEAGVSTIAFT